MNIKLFSAKGFLVSNKNIMYLIIGKNKCTHCNILKNLSDEKGVRYHYLDKEELPQTTTQYLKMYCTSYPMILKISHFSCFHDCLDYFNDI